MHLNFGLVDVTKIKITVASARNGKSPIFKNY